MATEINVRISDPETARAEIERTRARMSETIDEIEDVLIRKKEELRETLDIRARIREKPLHAAGIVLGAGLLFGFLTAGRKKDPRAARERLEAEARAQKWEVRARRLLEIARDQEDDLDDLESVVGGLLADRHVHETDEYGYEDEDEEDGDYEDEDEDYEEEDDEDDYEGEDPDDPDADPSRWSEIRHSLGARADSLAARAKEGLEELRRRV